jgi:DNA-binding NtrC family response regulator
MTIKGIIAKLETQQRDLKDIVDALRQLDLEEHKVDGTTSLDECERHLIAQALERAGGNQTNAARILQVSRDRLRYKMAKHGLIQK